MALTQADKEFIASLIAAALVPAADTAAPTAATPTASVRSADGRDFPCTATDGIPCARSLRSTKRAATHGVDAGGHEPRA